MAISCVNQREVVGSLLNSALIASLLNASGRHLLNASHALHIHSHITHKSEQTARFKTRITQRLAKKLSFEEWGESYIRSEKNNIFVILSRSIWSDSNGTLIEQRKREFVYERKNVWEKERKGEISFQKSVMKSSTDGNRERLCIILFLSSTSFQTHLTSLSSHTSTKCRNKTRKSK